MFPLHSDQFPTSADALARVLEKSLRAIIDVQNDIVSLREKSFPEFEELFVNLDGARLRTSAARPSDASGETAPAFRIKNLVLSANGMLVEEMPLDLAMRATNVDLHQGRDRAGKIVLLLHHADFGKIDVSVAKGDLEKFIATIAKREAGKHGVAVDDVKLSLHSVGQRAIEGTVQFRARKLFLSGVIRIAAKVDVDEKLTASVSGVTCTGDGAIGTLACNVLQPHLQRVNGRQFSLTALPLGDIALHNIELAVGESVRINAQFGRAV